MQWLRPTIEMAELSKTTMKLNSSLHKRVNVEIIPITVLLKTMKAQLSYDVIFENSFGMWIHTIYLYTKLIPINQTLEYKPSHFSINNSFMILQLKSYLVLDCTPKSIEGITA